MRLRKFLERIIPYGLYDGLRRALAGCETVLDVGCGTDSMMQHMARFHRVIGLDRYRPSLLTNRALGAYSGWVQGDIHALPFGDHSVDAVVAMDLIEHLEKAEGVQLLADMERLASRKVIILTPNGFVEQPPDDNPWQEHKSGWTVEEFEKRGYRVSGIYGWKGFRGPYARLRFRPCFFWEMLSALSHLFTAWNAGAAYHLLAVKTLDD